MAEGGYKSLISYKLSRIAFDLGWNFTPKYYYRIEDHRQRDQIKQALRSLKQNIVEGSSERSLSRKLNLYDVAKSSGMEVLEDFEDILRIENLPKWNRFSPQIYKLRHYFESDPSNPPIPSISSVCHLLGGIEGKDGIEAVANYEIDILIRCGYLLDKQMNSLEAKHTKEGGYNENLFKRRMEYKKRN